MFAIKSKKPYLGFCFSQEHRDTLEAWLIDQIFKCFQRADDELHEPDLAKLFNNGDDDGSGKPSSSGGGGGGGGGGPAAKAKPKQKSKAKPKADATLSKSELLNKLQQLDAEGAGGTMDDGVEGENEDLDA